MNQVSGHIFGSESWRNWKVDSKNCIPLPGEYCVYLTDKEGMLAGAVRDPLGLKPVYYTDSGNMFHTLKAAVHSTAQLTINWDYIYSLWAENFELHNSSPYNQIHRLPPGHVLFKSHGKWQTRAYFKEIAAENAQFKELFMSVIKDRAQTSPPFSVFLSGGFDSSLILAALKEQNFSPSFLSIEFSSGTASEQVGMQALRSRYNWQTVTLEGDNLSPQEFEWNPNNFGFYTPSLNLFKPLLRCTQSLGFKMVWTGIGADEVFSRSGSLLSTLLRHGEIQEFYKTWKGQKQCGIHSDSLLYAIAREFMPFSLRSALNRRLKIQTDIDLPKVQHFAQLRRSQRLLKLRQNSTQNELKERVFQSGITSFSTEQEQELAAEYGIEFSYPFYDLRLIAASLHLDHHEFFKNGLDKTNLRNSFADLLPIEISSFQSQQGYDDWSVYQWLYWEPKIKQWAQLQVSALEQSVIPLADFYKPWTYDFIVKNQNRLAKLVYAVRWLNTKEVENGKEKALREAQT